MPFFKLKFSLEDSFFVLNLNHSLIWIFRMPLSLHLFFRVSCPDSLTSRPPCSLNIHMIMVIHHFLFFPQAEFRYNWQIAHKMYNMMIWHMYTLWNNYHNQVSQHTSFYFLKEEVYRKTFWSWFEPFISWLEIWGQNKGITELSITYSFEKLIFPF